MKLVDSAAMQRIDAAAQESYGIPSIVLMESAGLLAWQETQRVVRAMREDGRIGADAVLTFVAGKGNNGGDALVMARYAALAGYSVAAVLAAEMSDLGEQAGVHARVIHALGVPVTVWTESEDDARRAIATAGLLVDGLAGTGIRGALRAPLDAMCDAMNESGAPVVAVDAPSGLGDEWRPGMPVVRAAWTLTMGLPKRCLYQPAARQACGEIVRVAVSFPSALLDDSSIPGTVLEPDSLAALLPPLDETAYKHRRGTVGVFAGARGTSGAVVLAAEAAHRFRAGLVTAYVDEAIYQAVAASVRSVMVKPLEDVAAVAEVAMDAACIGCGWGTDSRRREMLATLLGSAQRGVVDADGLNLIASMDDAHLTAEWVLTPHPGELGRLLRRETAAVLEDLTGAALDLAGRTGAIVVAKSHTTTVAHPDGRFAIVDGMNAAMGTGGSGDVLAGAIAALLAGGMTGWDAARAATLAHQVAGRRLRSRVGLFLAEELPAELGLIADGR